MCSSECVPPENCLALEDAPTGILFAYRVGCLPVMIPDQDQPDAEILAMLYVEADARSDIMDPIR